MTNEQTAPVNSPVDPFNKPIPLKLAVENVNRFRSQELNLTTYTYAEIFTKANIENYFLLHWNGIIGKQPKPIPADCDFRVGFFDMMDDADEISFCVAPVLVNNTNKIMLDPFDPDCPYHYTYWCGNLGVGKTPDDDAIFDMGEMWP